MKKATFAVAILAASTSAAWAQSSVTVYGVLDAGVSTVSGLKGGTKKMLVSGIMDGSRIGFKGTEDLGGGYRALFTLENRTELDTGAGSNVPPSGAQLPDRWSQGTLIFNTLPTFTLPASIPSALQPQLTGAATAGLTAALNSAATTLGGSIGATVGVNVGNARFFDRQAYVGLVTPVGAFLAGRQYTPAYEVSAEFDTLQTQSSLALGQVAAVPAVIDIRQSNALQYRVQSGPYVGSVMVAAGEGQATQGRFIAGMFMYRSDAISAGVGYNTRENELGEKSLRTASFGVSGALGPGRLSFIYNAVKDDNPSGLSAALTGLAGAINGQIKPGIVSSFATNPALGPTLGSQVGNLIASQIDTAALVGQYKSAFKQNAAVWGVGYRVGLGVHTVYVAYNRFNDKTRFNADTDSYGAVYSYAFSKRTDLNVVATHFNNKGLGQAAPGQAGFLGGVTSAAGVDSNNFALGLRHRF